MEPKIHPFSEKTKFMNLNKRIILHIPHASTKIPVTEGFIVDRDTLDKEILKLTDWYTDDLFESEEDDRVVADFSRIFCDPERFSDDSEEVMARYGMGVLYEKSDDGETIRKVTPPLKKRVLNDYYWPHHNQLSEAVKRHLKQFGKALIIDCHSFPDIPFKRDLDQNPNRPDFNIGTDAFHTPKDLTDTGAEFLKKAGYSVGIDRPYKGSIVPLEFYQQNENVHTIMLEINRKLYLKEPTNKKSERYPEIQEIVKGFIGELRNHFYAGK